MSPKYRALRLLIAFVFLLLAIGILLAMRLDDTLWAGTGGEIYWFIIGVLLFVAMGLLIAMIVILTSGRADK